MSVALWIVGLGLPLAAYLVMGILQWRSNTTVEAFVRNPRTPGITFSLVAINITVAGIFFGIIDGSRVYGWTIILAPLTTCLGLVVFMFFGTRAPDVPTTLGKALGQNPLLSLVISLAMILVYALAAGFEIYVTSQLLFGLGGFATHNLFGQLAIATGLLAVFMVYTVLGGFRAVVKTDCLQVALFCFLLLALCYHRWPDLTVFLHSSAELGIQLPKPAISASQIVAFSCSLLVLNTATQFLNPGNWLILTNAESRPRARRIFGRATLILILIWGIVVFLAFALPKDIMTNQLLSGLSPWVAMAAVAGLVAATLSTVDSLMLGSLKLVRDARDAFNPSTPTTLRRLRLLVPIIYLPALLLLLILSRTKPDLFSAMLAISNGMAVFLPVFGCIYFSKREQPLEPARQRFLAVAIATLFLLTAGGSIALVMFGKATSVVYVGPVALVLSALAAVPVFFSSKQF